MSPTYLFLPLLSAASTPEGDGRVQLFFISSVVIFIVVWRILARFFFKPIFAVLEEREARTSGDEKTAKELKERNSRLQRTLDEELKNVRLDAIKKRDLAVNLAKEEAAEQLRMQQSRLAAELKAAREQLTVVRQTADRELEAEAVRLAAQTYSRLLQPNSETIH